MALTITRLELLTALSLFNARLEQVLNLAFGA